MMQQCIVEVNGQFFLVVEVNGVSVRIQITAQLAAILQALGIPLCGNTNSSCTSNQIS